MSALPSIEIQLSAPATELLRRMQDTPRLLAAIARELDRQSNDTIAHISTKRMRGNNGKPFPVSDHILGIRSGQLYQSIRASKAQVQGDTVTSSIGTNIKYAGIHEYGGTFKRVLLAGSVRLATDRQGNLLRGKNGKLAVFARKTRKSVQTVAFPGGKRFEVTIPARAPFRHGIMDRLPALGDAISKTIIATLSGKGGAA